MNISLVTDEISSDIETALELGTDWGVHNYELRGIDSGRVPNISAYELDRTREAIETYGAKIVAISPGLFKIPYPAGARDSFPVRAIDVGKFQNWEKARELVLYHRSELLPASIEFAQELGAKLVIAFSFERTVPHELPPDEVLETLDQAASDCSRSGLGLALEVEEGHWADSGDHAARLVNTVGNPGLRINWDPGNVVPSGENPYPDGYEHVRGLVEHVHFKDVRHSGEVLEYAVEGEIDWEGQIAALADDRYEGYISVETHMRPKVASAQAAVDRLKGLVGKVS